MTSKQKDPFGNVFPVEQVECQIAFQSGNPAALHQILKVCELAKLPLPDWANVALKDLVLAHFDAARSGQVGEVMGCLSRPTTKFKKNVATAISVEIYKGVKKWQADPSRIDELPTSAIRHWYQKKIDPLHDHSNKAARDITCMSLVGTDFAVEPEALRKRLARLNAELGNLPVNKGHPPTDVELTNFKLRRWEAEDILFGTKYRDLYGVPIGPPPAHVMPFLVTDKTPVLSSGDVPI